MTGNDSGRLRADAVIVGGGLAGLWAALHLPVSWDVLIVDKERGPEAGSSPWAQGGMAVAVGPGDSPNLHAQDTLRAGAGACDPTTVEILTTEAPGALSDLVAMGCRFDTTPDGSWDLGREGGQSVARSVHAADATGREIMRVVVERARGRCRRLLGSATALLVAGGRCTGVAVATDHGDVEVAARATLLATGGCGALYEATTNPSTATGDGTALAFQAGAAVADLEFVQFHPTALATGGHQRVLLTEALRGDGAIVVDAEGNRFLQAHHPDGELAPRDVVARAIADRGGAFLDCRPVGTEALRRRFPNVTAAVADAGFDITAQPIPVAPAAHYFLGGVVADLDARTTIPGLYAAGECAATGVHGANRMAGNSLTEAVVFGRRAAVAMAAEDERPPAPGAATPDAPAVRAFRADDMERLRRAVTEGAGLVRTADGLEKAQAVCEEISTSGPRVLHAAALAASLICRSALERDESRGVHFRADHPLPDPSWEGRRVTLREY